MNIWKRNDDIRIQFFRYIIVGGLAFGIDYVTLFVLTEFVHIYYLLSAAISFGLGLTVNYILSMRWVFQSEQKNTISEFVIFGLIGVVGLGMNQFVIWFLTERIRIYYMISKLFSTAIVLLWNFLARRRLMMKRVK